MAQIINVIFTVVAVIALVSTTGVNAVSTDPAVFLRPSFLSQAATLAVPRMLTTIRNYTHAAQPGVTIPTASPNCWIQHDEIGVATVAFENVTIVPVNNTAVTVQFHGVQPLVTSTAGFSVACGYDGAFSGELELGQSGSFTFNVAFDPPIQYIATFDIQPGGNITLAPPTLVTKVIASATYGYESQGFALDMFVASYFEATLAVALEQELTTLLTYPSPFVAEWHKRAVSALSVFQFVCVTDVLSPSQGGTVPPALASTTVGFYLQPGCAQAPSRDIIFDSLATPDRNLLLLLPDSSGNMDKTRQHAAVAEGTLTSAALRSVAAMNEIKVANPGICTANVSCPPTLRAPVGDIVLTFSDCEVCYPNTYTQLTMAIALADGT